MEEKAVIDEKVKRIYDAAGRMISEYGGLQATDKSSVKYVLQNWQGSARAILNNTGFVLARMDYTAFGEEIGSGVGQRTTAQGFGATNNLTPKYGLTERDKATGLDHTWFRKNETRAGRWTSPDPYNGSMSLGNPQSFNKYAYVGNDPTNFVDPSGLFGEGDDGDIIRIQSIPGGWYDALWALYLGGLARQIIMPVTIGDPGGGGGGGLDGGTDSSPKPDTKKPKCRQTNTPAEHRAVEGQLNKVAPTGSIGPTRPATNSKGEVTEGILFDIYDANALHLALKNAGFETNTPLNADHKNQVHGSFYNTSDNRSDTYGIGNLGPDSNSNGRTRSLQIVYGPNKTDANGNKVATGYADLDCSNPAQDVLSALKHLFGR